MSMSNEDLNGSYMYKHFTKLCFNVRDGCCSGVCYFMNDIMNQKAFVDLINCNYSGLSLACFFN